MDLELWSSSATHPRLMLPTIATSHRHTEGSTSTHLTQLSIHEDARIPELVETGKRPVWAEFMAGGIGGMTAATLTSPLDVVRTRLQSDFYRPKLTPSTTLRQTKRSGLLPLYRESIHHFRETFQILSSIYRMEGYRALFKGLGPNLAGIVPSSSIKFYTYSNTKRVLSDYLGQETVWVHLLAATTAGITTSTVTNPIWVVKTRLQLDRSLGEEGLRVVKRKYKNGLDCLIQVARQEGIRGLYRGLSASYLGVTESTLHWMLYEHLKKRQQTDEDRPGFGGSQGWDQFLDLGGIVLAAGSSKLVAVVATYPYEVVRTRLRQAPLRNGELKYRNILQCFRLICKEEGFMAMYGGLTPHLLRSVPSTVILFGVYEAVMKVLDKMP